MSPPPHQPPRHPPPPQPQQPPHQPPPPQQQQPHQPPPEYQYYPYPYPPPHHHHHRPRSRSFASCILATTFLLTLILAAAITIFILFRPHDPTISVTSMRFPSFTVRSTAANFTFIQYAAVRNPNRYSFSHHGSSLQLISASAGPVGSIYIPAATIAAGRTQFVSATFLVKSFPVGDSSQGEGGGGGVGVSAVADSGSVVGPGPSMELETRMTLVGSVKVVQVFAHHVEVSARCRVSVRVTDGSILGYNC